ncbi:UNVERIFIED_ORG: hypothetical protein ABIB52_004634 [Arthrobacter sp. UYCu721]
MRNDDGPSRISDYGTDPATLSMGTLVIRTWYEPDQVQGFRARVLYGQGPGNEPNTVSTADPDEVLNVVREWLSSQPRSPGQA